MIKKPICEYNIVDCKILEESIDPKTQKKSLRVEVKWQQADAINSNKRRYRKEILEREINKLAPKIQNGEVMGSSYHPEGWGQTDDIASIWEKIWMNNDGACMGHLKVIPTLRGENVITILQNGGKLGMSSRGFGTVTPRTDIINGISETFDDVNDDYHLAVPGDFVISGSVGGTGITKILEEIESRFAKEAIEINENKKDKGDTLEIKTAEDLKKAYPEIVKSLEEVAVNTAKIEWEKTLDEKVKLVADENAELKVGIDEIKTAMAELVLGVSDSVAEYLPSMEDEQPGEQVVEDEEVVEISPEEVEQAEKEWNALETENAELKKKLEGKETPIEKKVEKKEEKIEVTATLTEEISALETQLKQKKIQATGLVEKGQVSSPDKLDEEAQLKNDRLSFRDAILSGWKGSFEDYRKTILKR